MDWNQQRVLVTGATGIVGTWLTRRLIQEGAYVVCLVLDRDPQSDLIRSGDISQTSVINGRLESFADVERAINEHEIDTVFHLGAQTIVGTALRNPLPTFEANIRGTYNLLEACRVHQDLVKRVVIASSDKAYGEVETLPYAEHMPVQGRHPYDVSKSCADLLAAAYAATYDLPVTVARCGNIYGGGDLNWSRIVPGTIRSALNDQRPILRSDGQSTRDYVYVLDVVDAYLTLGGRAADPGVCGEAFNFSAGIQISVLDLTRQILESMGRADLQPVVQNQARGEIKDQHLDSSKAKNVLHWNPRYALAEGLTETIQWYRGYLSSEFETETLVLGNGRG